MKKIKLAKDILISNFKRLKKPYKLTYAVTYKCNSRCLTCNIWKKNYKNELSLEDINEFFSRNNYFSWIDITGGEVFLRNDIIKIIKVILNNCKNLYMLHIPTNGLNTELITERVKEILSLKPYKLIISISLDGPPELYRKIRGVNGFNRAVETFKQLKGLNVETYFGITLSSYNADKINEIYKEVKLLIPRIKFKDFHLNIAHSSEHYYGNKINPLPKNLIIREINNFIKLKKFHFGKIGFLEKKYLKNIENYLVKNKTPVLCAALNASFFLDANGDIYVCSMYNKKVGNIKKDNFNELWNSKEIIDLHKQITNKCPQCWTPCEAYQSLLGNFFRVK